MPEQIVTPVLPSGEYVVIATIAHPAGSEIISSTGIVLGVREQGELPIFGTVIAVGSEVPPEVKELLQDSKVVLPTQHMTAVPHPDLVKGKIDAEQARKDPNKLSTCHYKAIQAVYGK